MAGQSQSATRSDGGATQRTGKAGERSLHCFHRQPLVSRAGRQRRWREKGRGRGGRRPRSKGAREERERKKVKQGTAVSLPRHALPARCDHSRASAAGGRHGLSCSCSTAASSLAPRRPSSPVAPLPIFSFSLHLCLCLSPAPPPTPPRTHCSLLLQQTAVTEGPPSSSLAHVAAKATVTACAASTAPVGSRQLVSPPLKDCPSSCRQCSSLTGALSHSKADGDAGLRTQPLLVVVVVAVVAAVVVPVAAMVAD